VSDEGLIVTGFDGSPARTATGQGRFDAAGNTRGRVLAVSVGRVQAAFPLVRDNSWLR